MKRKAKKLNLNRETLNALEMSQLKDVGGMLTTDPCLTNLRSCNGTSLGFCTASQGGAGGNTCCTQYC